MVLPLLGGTPAVWNTCMVFFQAGLLVGYAYAHFLPNRLGLGRHAAHARGAPRRRGVDAAHRAAGYGARGVAADRVAAVGR